MNISWQGKFYWKTLKETRLSEAVKSLKRVWLQKLNSLYLMNISLHVGLWDDIFGKELSFQLHYYRILVEGGMSNGK